jgi:hypothetical protein
MAKHQVPRRLSLVGLIPGIPKRRYPFLREHVLVFLGEIPNMRGHCAVAGFKSGRIYAPFPVNLFTELIVRKAR